MFLGIKLCKLTVKLVLVTAAGNYQSDQIRSCLVDLFQSLFNRKYFLLPLALQHRSDLTAAQIDNLRRRLYLTRAMQILGIASLFLCVVTMFLLYIGLQLVAAYVFGAGLLALIGSLGVSIREIQISVRALEIYLNDMEH